MQIFIINNGKATASDLENLGKLIIDKVYNKFDIKLRLGDKNYR